MCEKTRIFAGFSAFSPTLKRHRRSAVSAVLLWQRKGEMSDLQEQLAELRQRVARIDRKFASRSSVPAPPRTQAFQHVEQWLSGEEVETTYGRHFETEKLYERYRRHGSADIGSLAELPVDLLHTLS